MNTVMRSGRNWVAFGFVAAVVASIPFTAGAVEPIPAAHTVALIGQMEVSARALRATDSDKDCAPVAVRAPMVADLGSMTVIAKRETRVADRSPHAESAGDSDTNPHGRSPRAVLVQ